MKNKIVKYPSPYPIFLSNSPERIFEVFNESNNFLKNNKKYTESINLYLLAHREILYLIPQDIYSFMSGHVFPLCEAEYELESSIGLVLFGFYKQAMQSLRNFIEIGLLSLYWNIDNTGHITIQIWLHSLKKTPSREKILKQILKNRNKEKFNNKVDIIKEINIYTKNFVITYIQKVLNIPTKH